MRFGHGALKDLALPFSAFIERCGFGALIALALALLILGKLNYGIVQSINTSVSDAFAPVMALLREPVDASKRFTRALGEMAVVYEENARLREQNRKLLEWHGHAQRLASENRELRRVLGMEVEPPAAVGVAARVVADAGGSFVRTVLINAGRRRGVTVGMAAIDELGLVGRVIEVGANSARVLLLTDFNSRIPAMVEPSRDQALLAGDNSREPGLVFLPLNPRISVGDRVVTSGRGGVLPPGLPIGVVSRAGEDKIAVRTWVDFDRLDHLRLLEYATVVPPERLEEMQREAFGPPLPPDMRSRSRETRSSARGDAAAALPPEQPAGLLP